MSTSAIVWTGVAVAASAGLLVVVRTRWLQSRTLEKCVAPEAADLFQLGDFSIVAIEPTLARFVAGFARALTLSAETLTGVFHESSTS